MFKALSLRMKLTFIFATFSLCLAIVGTVGFFSVQYMASRYHRVATEILPKTIETAELRAVAQVAGRQLALLANPSLPKADKLKIAQQIPERMQRFEEALKAFGSYQLSSDEHELFEQSSKDWAVLRPLFEEAIRLSQLDDAKSVARLQQVAGIELVNIMANFSKASTKIRTVLHAETEEELSATENAAQRISVFTLASVIAGIVASFIFSLVFGTAISKKLRLVAAVFADNVIHVSHQASEMADASAQLSSAVMQQSAALQMTSASIQEIGAMVNMNADNATRSNGLALHGTAGAKESQASLQEMLEAIEGINASNAHGLEGVRQSNVQLNTVLKVITDIGEKTKVINDIVFQTKLLSFNASVEAARAGEHGKGFAIVAEEVGNLAAMSGQASREISDMLGAGIASVNTVVENTRTQLDRLMQDSQKSVQHSSEVASRCRETLEHLAKNVTELQAAIGHISTASHEQAQGVAGITEAIREIDGVTETNRTLALRSAQSSQVLKERSTLLEQSLQDLQETVNGRGETAA